ncbi:hypothetical protein CQA09_28915, partial [Klebsiella pneumoniae]
GVLAQTGPGLALTEAMRPYVPHVTLGAWSAAWPRDQVLQWMSGLPMQEHWQAAVGRARADRARAGADRGDAPLRAPCDAGRLERCLA